MSEHSNTETAVRTSAKLKVTDWWAILKRLIYKIDEYHVPLLSAAIAFYAMLAIFPALAAVVTLYALVFDPSDVSRHLNLISHVIPGDVLSIFKEQIDSITSTREQSLGISLIVGLGFAMWSAQRGVHALVNAITIAYQEKETRHFLYLNGFSMLLTVGAVFMVLSALVVMLALPLALNFLPVSDWESSITKLFSWIVLFTLIIVSFSLLYRFSPPRRSPKWRWLSPGSLLATMLWILSSFAFSRYVSEFGNYNETYGTLGAIIVLQFWFFLTSFSIVLGALLNAELEL